MKIKFKAVSKKLWKQKSKHGYTTTIDGHKYILTSHKGTTTLQPVKIRRLGKTKYRRQRR